MPTVGSLLTGDPTENVNIVTLGHKKLAFFSGAIPPK